MIMIMSRLKTNAFVGVAFFTGLVILGLNGMYWPGIALLTGIVLVGRQLLRGRISDACFSGLVFFALVQWYWWWGQVIAAPASLTLLVRELLHIRHEDPEEVVEELKAEIEEDQHE
jgi:hypothetical protein